MMKKNYVPRAAHVLIKSALPRPVLAGKLAGDADAPTLRAAIERESTTGSPVVLDLAGVDALSSSYFASAFLPLWARPWPSDALPPLLANLSAHVIDDVRLAVEANSANVWSVRWSGGAVDDPRVLGKLDDLDRRALDGVMAEGHTDAASLFARNRSIGLTAWSTRLGTLHQKGLLRRHKDGRRMTYTPPWKD